MTLEDIVEEIVGEIEDEHDDATPRIEATGQGCWSIDASVSLSDVGEELESELDSEFADFAEGDDYESIGGLIVHLAGEVPAVGHVLEVDGFEFKVLAGDERRISRVQLRRMSGTPPSGG